MRDTVVRRKDFMRPSLIVLLLLACAVAQPNPTSPARPAITGVAHVAFYAKSLPQSAEFYRDLLGLLQTANSEETGGMSFYLSGTQRVDLIPQHGTGPAGLLDHIAFQTADAEALRRDLAARGIGVPASVTSHGDGSRLFRTRDFEDHQIEFVQIAKSSKRSTPGSVSHRVIHAGFVVRDRAAADRFYRDLLGFHLYWHGGRKDDETDWVDMQVPDGTDWLEYMLNVPPNAPARQLGVVNHVALGVADVHAAADILRQRGWKESDKEQPKIGHDGKWQLNLYDPDGTRVEMMEFRPVQKPCCAEYTGQHPN